MANHLDVLESFLVSTKKNAGELRGQARHVPCASGHDSLRGTLAEFLGVPIPENLAAPGCCFPSGL